MTFPKECPAFKYKGRIYEGRPGHAGEEDVLGLTLVNDSGGSSDMRLTLLGVESYKLNDDAPLDEIKPLTPAARRLMKWVRA